MLDAVLVVLAGGLGEPDRHHLRGIVPFVDRRRDVEALVALQADQPAAERGGENLGDFRLADARLALEKQRPAQSQAQEDDGRQRALRDIGGAASSASVSSIEAGGGTWPGADWVIAVPNAWRRPRAASRPARPCALRISRRARFWQIGGRSARRRHRALGEHADEVGAVIGVGVDVGVEARRPER